MKRLLKKLLTFIYTLYAKYSLGNFKTKVKVNGFTRLSKNTTLGENVNFNGLIIQGNGKCHFGNNFHSGPNCKIITINHNYDGGSKIPYDETYIIKDVFIHANVWLGADVTILGGTTIGEGAIMQAGSVVVKDIPKYAIAGGHPAKVFSQRDINHYEKLKHEERFH